MARTELPEHDVLDDALPHGDALEALVLAADTSPIEADWWHAVRATPNQPEGRAAREQLIAHYLPHARMVAAMVYRTRYHDEIEFADYLQLASVGLIEAIDRFDATRGVPFRSYATWRVRGAILNGLDYQTEKQQQIAVRRRLRDERLESIKQYVGLDLECAIDGEVAADVVGKLGSDVDREVDRKVAGQVDRQEGGTADGGVNGAMDAAADDAVDETTRRESAEHIFRRLSEVGIGLALSCLLDGSGMIEANADATVESYYRGLEFSQLRNRLLAVLATLPEREQQVIRYHYLQETPFVDIAALMGITKGRVAQLHHQALRRLAETMHKVPACDVAW